MATKNKITQLQLLMEYYKQNPNRDIPHEEIVDWATSEWEKRKGKKFRDPDRGIRSLYELGQLQQVRKGIYRYDPDAVQAKSPENFTPAQRKQIFAKDDHKCVICGEGQKEGKELHADHIKPRDKGGKATIENGQTLCSKHNMLKKNFNQTETGKKMFIRLYELADKEDNDDLRSFCEDVLKVYDTHDINGHIDWDKK